MINEKRFGFAGGIVCGVAMFLITIFSVITGNARTFLDFAGNLYPGYTISYMGAILGLVLGFVDGFIKLYVIAWLYNKVK